MKERFSRFADRVAIFAGHPYTVAGVILTIIIWAGFGPLFGFSDTWQLVINTATTIFTWVLVHVLQASQNKSDKAMHAKLDSILLYLEADDANKAMGIESLDEKNIDKVKEELQRKG